MDLTDLKGIGQVTCPNCEEEFKSIGQHWTQGDCNEPEFSSKQYQIVRGLLLGDGSIARYQDGNPVFQLRMTNEEFIDWINEKLGIFSTGKFRTYDEERDNWNKKKMYGVRTRSLEQLKEFSEWYREDGKRFPEDLTLSPLEAKMWYVSDGCLQEIDGLWQVEIANHSQSNQAEVMEEALSKTNIEISYSSAALRVSTKQTKEFLKWLGEPVPGFEYKWEVN